MIDSSRVDTILLKHGAEQGELNFSLKKDLYELILNELVGKDAQTNDEMSNRLFNNIIGGNIVRKLQRQTLAKLFGITEGEK